MDRAEIYFVCTGTDTFVSETVGLNINVTIIQPIYLTLFLYGLKFSFVHTELSKSVFRSHCGAQGSSHSGKTWAIVSTRT